MQGGSIVLVGLSDGRINKAYCSQLTACLACYGPYVARANAGLGRKRLCALERGTLSS